ncbi:MAG: methionyl-tRNA formyltransferase [Azovibrio sp.]
MRIIFAGTPEFAASALAALIEAGHQIPLVLTQPDRPAGRGLQLHPSPVKQLAQKHGLEILQPLSLKKDLDAQETIRNIGADVMVVAAYGLILPQSVLDIPPLGCLNIHASLLPRWRGAAPIQRAILAGDPETGICIMQMEAGLDTGPVLARASTPISPTDSAGDLHDRLALMGGQLIVSTLARLPLIPEPQPDTGITYAAKIEKSEAALDWNLGSVELDRHIRAFNPFPAAQTLFQGTPIKIWRAHPVAKTGTPGTVLSVDKTGIYVACGTGALCITELQKAGGKRLNTAQFLAGHSIKPNENFG